MINKMVTREINKLEDKIEELERNLEQARQGNRFWVDKHQALIKKHKEARGQIYDLVLDNQELNAELTYWKETAEYWEDVVIELEHENKYLDY